MKGAVLGLTAPQVPPYSQLKAVESERPDKYKLLYRAGVLVLTPREISQRPSSDLDTRACKVVAQQSLIDYNLNKPLQWHVVSRRGLHTTKSEVIPVWTAEKTHYHIHAPPKLPTLSRISHTHDIFVSTTAEGSFHAIFCGSWPVESPQMAPVLFFN